MEEEGFAVGRLCGKGWDVGLDDRWGRGIGKG